MSQHPTVNLMIDFQYSSSMPIDQMETEIKRVAAHVEEMRRAGIPTVWVTLGEKAGLDTGTTGATGPRSVDSLNKAGFFGHGPDTDPAHLAKFQELMAKYGPRADEAVYTKPYFGAFTEQKHIERFGAHLAQVRSDIPNPHEALNGPTLAKYLHDMGVKEVTLMGGNSNVCVTETAMGAAMNGIKATVLSDRVVSHDDQSFSRSRFQMDKVRGKLNNITDNPAALANDQTHSAFSNPDLLTTAEKRAIRHNVEVRSSTDYLRPVVRAQRSRFMPPEGVTRHAGAATGVAGIALDIAEGRYGQAITDMAVQLSLDPATYKAAGALTREAGAVGKSLGFVTRKIPVVGAFVTAGFVLYEVGSSMYAGEYGKAGAALAAGTAEAAGNIVGFGVGDVAREVVREGVVRTAGEEYAPEKSGLRQLGERAVSIATRPTGPKP